MTHDETPTPESPPPGWGQQPPPPPGWGQPPQQPPPSGYWAPPPPPAPGYWAPPSQLSPSEERTWAMLAHIGALIASLVAFAALGPLIIMLTQGNKSAFVRRHAVESLNFQITLMIALAAGTVLAIATLGFGLIVVIPVAIGLFITALVLIILAGVKANNGEDYRYPLTIRLVK